MHVLLRDLFARGVENDCSEQCYLFIATLPSIGWQRSEGLLLLHSFVSSDILAALSIVRLGASAMSVSRVDVTQFNKTLGTRWCSGMHRMCTSAKSYYLAGV